MLIIFFYFKLNPESFKGIYPITYQAKVRAMKKLSDHLGKITIILIATSVVGFVAVTPILGDEFMAQNEDPHPKFIWYETAALKVLIFSTALMSIGWVLIFQKIKSKIIEPYMSIRESPHASTFKDRLFKNSSAIGLLSLGLGLFTSFLYATFPHFFGRFGVPNFSLQFEFLALICYAFAGLFFWIAFKRLK
jgi:hypothetical protein